MDIDWEDDLSDEQFLIEYLSNGQVLGVKRSNGE